MLQGLLGRRLKRGHASFLVFLRRLGPGFKVQPPLVEDPEKRLPGIQPVSAEHPPVKHPGDAGELIQDKGSEVVLRQTLFLGRGHFAHVGLGMLDDALKGFKGGNGIHHLAGGLDFGDAVLFH